MGCSSSKDVSTTAVVPSYDRSNSGAENLLETAMKMKKIKKERNVRAKELEDDKDYVPPEKTEKPAEVSQLLSQTLHGHWLFSDLEEDQIQGLVDVMSKSLFEKGDDIIKQGDDGKQFYIVSSGTCSVTVDGKLLGHKITKGTAFGDLALFYEAPRSATITATESCEVYSLDQSTFRHHLQKRTKDYVESNIKFLNSVPAFEGVGESQIIRLANAMNSATFKKGAYIVKQGDVGNIFYILKSGECKVVENDVEKDRARISAGRRFVCIVRVEGDF